MENNRFNAARLTQDKAEPLTRHPHHHLAPRYAHPQGHPDVPRIFRCPTHPEGGLETYAANSYASAAVITNIMGKRDF